MKLTHQLDDKDKQTITIRYHDCEINMLLPIGKSIDFLTQNLASPV